MTTTVQLSRTGDIALLLIDNPFGYSTVSPLLASLAKSGQDLSDWQAAVTA